MTLGYNQPTVSEDAGSVDVCVTIQALSSINKHWFLLIEILQKFLLLKTLLADSSLFVSWKVMVIGVQAVTYITSNYRHNVVSELKNALSCIKYC